MLKNIFGTDLIIALAEIDQTQMQTFDNFKLSEEAEKVILVFPHHILFLCQVCDTVAAALLNPRDPHDDGVRPHLHGALSRHQVRAVQQENLPRYNYKQSD